MGKVRRSASVLATVVAFALLGTACATTSAQNRGSLSDAMDKARDDHEGSRSVPDESRDGGLFPDRDPVPDSRREFDDGAADGAPAGGSAISVEDMRLAFRGGRALADGGDIVTSFDGDILLGAAVGAKWDVNAFAGLKVAAAEDGSDLDASVKDSIGFLRIGVEGRFSPYPKWTVFSPYLLGGGGGYLMFWSFRNALTAGEERIESDSLGGLLLYAGIGANLVKTKRMRIGLSLIGDGYFFTDVTGEGFNNDVFGTYGTTRLVGEISFLID